MTQFIELIITLFESELSLTQELLLVASLGVGICLTLLWIAHKIKEEKALIILLSPSPIK